MRRVVWLLVMVVLVGVPAASIMSQDSAPPGVTIHVVQRGETLFRIALSYSLTIEELATLNGLANPNDLQVGQRLLVPSAVPETTTLPDIHIVQPGETLRSIADLYHLTTEELTLRNNLADPNRIYVGQSLTIAPPPAAPAPTAAPPVSAQFQSSGQNLIHTVLAGETLFRIATSYGLTVNDLVQANQIADPTLIYAGQRLIVPGVEPPQLALDLPDVVSGLEVMPLIWVEGETGRLRMTTTSPMSVSGSFLEHPLSVVSDQNKVFHTALVGVPVFTEPGVYPLSILLSDNASQQINLTLNIQIVSGNYGNESITLAGDQSDLLNPNVEAPEQNLLQNVMTKLTVTRYFDGPMGLPAAASVTSPFGLKRSYNGGPFNRFHTGTDFAGAPGTPVLAAASGYVVLSDHLHIRGNATIIDHGWGVFTGYWHQTEQYVHVGDFVTTGQVIGTIGSTGRVTGPHLHWELWVAGVAVNPMQWVLQSFS